MYSLVILLTGLTASMAGFYLASGGRLELKGFAGSLPVLFLAAQAASHVSSASSWPVLLVMVVGAAGLMMPLVSRAERMGFTRSLEFSAVQLTSLIMLFVAVFQSLVLTGVSPVVVLGFVAAGFCYVAVVNRFGKFPALVASSVLSLSSLLTSFTVSRAVFTPDITLIVLILATYAVGTLSHGTLEKLVEALTPVHLSLIILLAVAVLLSPFSPVEPPPAIDVQFESILLLPAVFLAFSTAGYSSAPRPFEAALLVLAVSVVAVGGSFPQASAKLLALFVGEPLLNTSAELVQAVLHLVGLSALAMILCRMSMARRDAGLEGRASLTYGVPAGSVALAVSASLGFSAGDSVLLAGALNMMTFAVLLAAAGGKSLAAAAFLLLVSFNTVVFIASRTITVLSFETAASLLPPAYSMAVMVLGTWAFSHAVVKWLLRRNPSEL
ncbi:MAG: hypothetical protein QXO30_02925 [Candidatus Caldarchaeum sp.]